MPSWPRILALLLPVTLLPCACERELISDDLQVQGRFETAKRALQEIEDARKRGREFRPQCAVYQAQFLDELKRSDAPAARRVAKGLAEACKEVNPRPLE